MLSIVFSRGAVPKLLVINGALKFEDTFWEVHKLWWDPKDYLHASIPLYVVEARKQMNIYLNVWRHSSDLALYFPR